MIRRILKLVLILCVAGAAMLTGYVWATWDRVWDVAAPDLHASSDPEIIAYGQYLVYGPAHCVECHVSSMAEFERFASTGAPPKMSGGLPFKLGPLGTIYARNITTDPETGIGRYSDPLIARMLRHGVRPDGKASIPLMMPYGDMSDDDVVAVLSFLRTLEPVRKTIPSNEWTTFGKVIKCFVAAARPRMDIHPPKVAPPQEATKARGEYLALSVGNCVGCHSPRDVNTGALTGPAFSGGGPMEPIGRTGVDPSLWFRPPNITPLPKSALSNFPDRATFVARFQKGGRKYEGSPMPWESIRLIAAEDLGALYEFLYSLPPSGAPSPQEPTIKQ